MIFLDVQIYSFLLSLLFGSIFYLFVIINYKVIVCENSFIKIFGSFLIVVLGVLSYFLLLQKVNNGIIHYYLIIALILGYYLSGLCIKLVAPLIKK